MKKRILSCLMTVCLVLTMLPTWVFAAEENGISTSVTEVRAGDTFTVTLNIPSISEALSNIEFNISFNKDVFEVTEYTKPSFATMSNTAAEANNAGRLTCTNTSSTGDNDLTVLQSGGTMTATFKVKADAASNSYDFVVSKYEIKSINEETYLPIDRAPAGTVKTASVTVVSTISGEQNITGVTAPAKNAAPTASGDLTAPANTTVTIKWFAVPESGTETELTTGNFVGDTVYKAVINVKPGTGYVFADGVTFTVDGENWDAAKKSDGSYDLTKTFGKTAGKDALTGSVTISNTSPRIGDMLTAQTGSLNYGTESAGTLSYQWKAGEGVVGTDSATYTVQTADRGKTITVTVSNSNNSGSVTSAATEAVQKAAGPATVPTVPSEGDITALTDVIQVAVTAGQEYGIGGK